MTNEILKTGYDWCLEANIRLLDIENWDTDMAFYTPSYYEEKINKEEFLSRISLCRVKPNSSPRKTDEYLEYRMYFLVPYNISPIQQSIQSLHAAIDYGRAVRDLGILEMKFNKWADKDKTVIILNGGTTNNNIERLGTLNKHMNTLKENDVFVMGFSEPDLGDQLTGVAFLIDERVFNRELYPDFVEEKLPYTRTKPSKKAQTELDERNEANYQKWVEKVGNEKNAFLRDFLKQFRLA